MRHLIHPNVWVNSLMSEYKIIGSKIKNGFNGHPFDALETDIDEIYPNWIVTDVRFENEAEAIRKRKGIIIRIDRPIIKIGEKFKVDFCNEEFTCTGYSRGLRNRHYLIDNTQEFVREENILYNVSTHISETALDNYNFDYLIQNDDTIDFLISKVEDILTKEKIINV